MKYLKEWEDQVVKEEEKAKEKAKEKEKGKAWGSAVEDYDTEEFLVSSISCLFSSFTDDL